MAIAHVQTPAGGVANSSATSVALAFASNVTAGSMIVVGWRYSVGGRTVTCSDSKGNTYANVVEAINTADGNSTQGISYAMNCAAGATTVTFAISGGALNLRMACSEFSGAALSAGADQSASAIGTATNMTTATVTPSTNGQVFFYVVHTQADTLITAGTDFTEATKVPTGAANRLQIEYYIQPTAAAHVGAATMEAGGTSWGCAVATFKVDTGPIIVDYITQEDTFKILLEDGSGALLGENGTGSVTPLAARPFTILQAVQRAAVR